MPELACKKCNGPVERWRRNWSCYCDGCDLISPMKRPLSPVVRPHVVTDPLELREYSVDTVVNAPLIEQTIDLAGAVTRRVLNTSDHQIRKALIELGWTPPTEKD